MVAVGGIEYGPGLAAVVVLCLSLAAKLFMSFSIRAGEPKGGYQPLDPQIDRVKNASEAQLNVAEYEALFIAIFLFLHIEKTQSLLVTIITITIPVAQAVYFWGRVLSGNAMPWAPLGALPRYICIGISIYVLYTEVGSNGDYGPGLAAVAVLSLSFAAKLYMSFVIRGPNAEGEKKKNASEAQLNVKEYEALFIAIFLFLHVQKAENLPLTIVCYGVPIAQAVYFWGRVLSGNIMPWAPLGALPRYICIGITIYVLHTAVGSSDGYGPGLAAVAVLSLSFAAKLYMSFGIRAANVEGEKKENASKTQLNVAEYEDLFIAIFLFLYVQDVDNMLVTIVTYTVPIAQAVYFWGRVISGNMMPWAPLGALPRYICMGISIYILFTATSK